MIRLFDNSKKAFSSYRSETINNPHFIIRLGKFIPNNEGCVIVDDKFYIKNNYFFCMDDYKITNWEIEMYEDLNGVFIVNINTNIIGGMIIQDIVDFCIHYILTMKGYSIVHGSAISKKSKAYMFIGLSGSGKTSLAIKYAENNYDFLSDNFVVFNRDNIYNYLSPFSIFTYNVTPFIKRHMNHKDRLWLTLKYILYILTNKYIKILTPLNPKLLFPNNIINSSKPSAVFYLYPKKEINIKPIKIKELIKSIIYNQQLDYTPFYLYLLEYSYVYPNSYLGTFWKKYETNLYNNLKNLNLYQMEVPINILNEISDVINKLGEIIDH